MRDGLDALGDDVDRLLIIDADHFTNVNDTYGHGTGDDVLRALARTVKDQVRELDLSRSRASAYRATATSRTA